MVDWYRETKIDRNKTEIPEDTAGHKEGQTEKEEEKRGSRRERTDKYLSNPHLFYRWTHGPRDLTGERNTSRDNSGGKKKSCDCREIARAKNKLRAQHNSFPPEVKKSGEKIFVTCKNEKKGNLSGKEKRRHFACSGNKSDK